MMFDIHIMIKMIYRYYHKQLLDEAEHDHELSKPRSVLSAEAEG